ncbi:MAG: hypothetical protein ACOCRK_06065 [bacterium]
MKKQETKLKNIIYDYLCMLGYDDEDIKDYQLRQLSKATSSKDEAFYACELYLNNNYSIHQLTNMLRNGNKTDRESVTQVYDRLNKKDKYDKFNEKIEDMENDTSSTGGELKESEEFTDEKV